MEPAEEMIDVLKEAITNMYKSACHFKNIAGDTTCNQKFFLEMEQNNLISIFDKKMSYNHGKKKFYYDKFYEDADIANQKAKSLNNQKNTVNKIIYNQNEAWLNKNMMSMKA